MVYRRCFESIKIVVYFNNFHIFPVPIKAAAKPPAIWSMMCKPKLCMKNFPQCRRSSPPTTARSTIRAKWAISWSISWWSTTGPSWATTKPFAHSGILRRTPKCLGLLWHSLRRKSCRAKRKSWWEFCSFCLRSKKYFENKNFLFIFFLNFCLLNLLKFYQFFI